jgi:hypothetical protein
MGLEIPPCINAAHFNEELERRRKNKSTVFYYYEKIILKVIYVTTRTS